MIIFNPGHANRNDMRKTAITLLILLVSINICHSQSENKKTVFSVNAGISVPYGDFANSKMEVNAGFASAGPNIEFDLLRYGRFFGLSSSIGYANIFIDEQALTAGYDLTIGEYGENRVTAGNYQFLKGLAGFIIKVPEFRNTDIMFLFHLGYALGVHPDIEVTNSELGVVNSVKRSVAGSVTGNAGVKVNYWLTDRYGLSLNYGVNLTRPCFKDETSIDGLFFLPVRYRNFNIGFVMNLKQPVQ
jgi:hypothetical protein